MKTTSIPEKKRSPSHGQVSHNASCKSSRILTHLLAGATLNRFDAERLGDHCLNSTISTLANLHGLSFVRQPEKVPNRWGKPCRVIRYSLPVSEHEKARKRLASLMSNIRPFKD